MLAHSYPYIRAIITCWFKKKDFFETIAMPLSQITGMTHYAQLLKINF